MGSITQNIDSGKKKAHPCAADGRVIIRAAQEHAVRTVGIEANRELYEHSRNRIRTLELEDRVTLKHADFNDEDLKPANLICESVSCIVFLALGSN